MSSEVNIGESLVTWGGRWEIHLLFAAAVVGGLNTELGLKSCGDRLI